MDLERAKTELSTGCTCAVCREQLLYTTDQRGVAPLLQWLDSSTDLMGFSAADKAVGKAAAMLYCLLGVRRVHGKIMSVGAVKILRAQGIEATWDILTEEIRNRRKDGPCPLEAALRGIEDPEDGLTVIRQTLRTLPH